MRADPNKMHQLKSKKRGQVNLRFNERKMRQGHQNRPIITVSLADLYERILAGLQRLFIAIKYRFYQVTAGFFEKVRFPWFKLGLAALAIFIVLKKDIHFSINMQAPLGEMADDQSEDGARTSEMSFVKTVSVAGNREDQVTGLPEVDDIDGQKARAYIKRFSKVAMTEMEKFGIPASVKMAQALLESNAGEHPAARQANNHFGRPLAGSSYNSAWENWRAHSLLITEDYADQNWGSNYKNWARGLEQGGYNAAKDYAEKLEEVINTYDLYDLDE